MDGNRFDHLTKHVAGSSRRALLKTSMGIAVAGVASIAGRGQIGAAGKQRGFGQTCKTASDCLPGMPCKNHPDGRRRCGCLGSIDCPSGLCDLAICVAGTCGVEPKRCDDSNPCTIDSCDPQSGQCLHTAVADDTPCDDDDACTTGDTCQSGVCTGEPRDCSLSDGIGLSTAVCSEGACVCPAETTICQRTAELDDRFACCRSDEHCEICGGLLTPRCLGQGILCLL